LSEARQKTVEISLIHSTSKLALGTLFDPPNEGPGACAGLSLINLNLGVHLSIVLIGFSVKGKNALFDFVEIGRRIDGPHTRQQYTRDFLGFLN